MIGLPVLSSSPALPKFPIQPVTGTAATGKPGQKRAYRVAQDEKVTHGHDTRLKNKRRKITRLLIQAAQVLYRDELTNDMTIIVMGGLIKDVKPTSEVTVEKGDEVHTYFGETAAPGFIDTLIHGADGHDVMDGTVEAILGIARRLPEEGVTGFLPSSMTASYLDTRKAAKVIAEAAAINPPSNAAVLGWHAEGPYFSPSKMGCHNPDCRQDPSIREVSKWWSASHNLLKIITVAPELPGAVNLIRWAIPNGIVVSLGHTAADYQETQAAIAAGAGLATHIYNAMAESHQRTGCALCVQRFSNIPFTIIVDGLHLDRHFVQTLTATTPDFSRRAILISDGIRAKYKPDGIYEFGGMKIEVREGAARLTTGEKNLAGSIVKMNEAVANIQTFSVGAVSRSQALLMASHNPAKLLNLERSLGMIHSGMQADIVILGEGESVIATYRKGRRIFYAREP
ncbi:MAG: N-acetylglucosamine-6-phosphate deacetylase [Endozoicomonas sp.]